MPGALPPPPVRTTHSSVVRPLTVISDRTDSEHRMIGSDTTKVLVRRVGTHPSEEHTHLRLPAFEVVAQDRHALLFGNFARFEGLDAPADAQLSRSGRAQVAHPLRLAPRRNKVLIALAGQEVHRGRSPLTALSATHAQLARAPDAEARPREQCHRPVEDVPREPAGTLVARRRLALGHSPLLPVAVTRGDPRAGRFRRWRRGS